jgi:hypothetical protein
VPFGNQRGTAYQPASDVVVNMVIIVVVVVVVVVG